MYWSESFWDGKVTDTVFCPWKKEKNKNINCLVLTHIFWSNMQETKPSLQNILLSLSWTLSLVSKSNQTWQSWISEAFDFLAIFFTFVMTLRHHWWTSLIKKKELRLGKTISLHNKVFKKMCGHKHWLCPRRWKHCFEKTTKKEGERLFTVKGKKKEKWKQKKNQYCCSAA